MQGAATFVDVSAIGRDVDESCLNAEVTKKFGGLGGGASVGAVDQNAQAAQVGGDARLQRFDVGVAKFGLAGQGRSGELERGVFGGSSIVELGENFLLDS